MAVAVGTSTTPKEEKDLAQTPVWFMKSLEYHLGTKINLDVCCLEATAKADIYYSLLEHGSDCLVEDWVTDWQEITEDNTSYPTAYCNPPFSNILPFIDKAIYEVGLGAEVVMMLPNNPETSYIRKAKKYATKIIEMPFRLKFVRPNGEPFLDKHGKVNSPKFSCLIAVFTKKGLGKGAEYYYHDFRLHYEQQKLLGLKND